MKCDLKCDYECYVRVAFVAFLAQRQRDVTCKLNSSISYHSDNQRIVLDLKIISYNY